VTALQDVLRARGAPVSGRKAELVQRIEELQRAAAPQAPGGSDGSASENAAAGSPQEPVVLSDDEAEEI
jgi:SAP domain